MRETKFRAWAKTGYMFQVTQILWNRKGTLEYVRGERLDGRGTIGGHEKHINMSDIALIEYTGLKDRNGVEIYEGDIVRVYNYLEGKIWEGHTHDEEVVFLGGGFDLKNPWCHESLEGNEVEIIGNIYENPELLK